MQMGHQYCQTFSQIESYFHVACLEYQGIQQSYVQFQFTNVNIDTTSSLNILSHYQRALGRLNHQNKSEIIFEIGEIHMQSLVTLKSSNIGNNELRVISYE